MKAVILAAGEGARMRPLTLVKPKVLIEVSGKPFLYFLFKNLEKAGIRDITIVCGHKKELINAFLREYHFVAAIVEQAERLGTGHAVSLLKDMINEDFIVLYGDNLYSPEDIRSMQVKDDYCYLATYDHPNPEKYGVVHEERGFLKEIIEKPEKNIGNTINVGLYKFTPLIFDALRKIKKSPRGEYELTDALTALAKQKKVRTRKLKDYWIDFGSLEDIPLVDKKISEIQEELQLDYYFEDLGACPVKEAFAGVQYPWEALKKKDSLMKIRGQHIDGNVDKTCIIKGDVKIGAGTVIEPFVFIEGPVIIGKNCHIRSFSRIRPGTVIGNNCVIGNGVEVKNSIFFDEAKTSSHSFIGDSIIGKGARIASGVVIGNRRLDQKPVTFYVHDRPFPTDTDKMGAVVGDYVRLGANCSTTPGALIGKYSWVYANILVRSFVPKNSLLKLRQAVETVNKESVVLERLDREGKV